MIQNSRVLCNICIILTVYYSIYGIYILYTPLFHTQSIPYTIYSINTHIHTHTYSHTLHYTVHIYKHHSCYLGILQHRMARRRELRPAAHDAGDLCVSGGERGQLLGVLSSPQVDLLYHGRQQVEVPGLGGIVDK